MNPEAVDQRVGDRALFIKHICDLNVCDIANEDWAMYIGQCNIHANEDWALCIGCGGLFPDPREMRCTWTDD